jgi:thymidylate synthase (FAD)
MVDMCVEITTTRDIGRQLLRHRSFYFQEFCVAEGTLVTLVDASGNSKKRPIEKLYEYQHDPRVQAIWDRGIRVYDEGSKTFVRAKLKEVFKTGVKPCFKVTLEDGKTITCTEEHRFFTQDGFARLADLSTGARVAVNGQEAYRSLDWLREAKVRHLRPGAGVGAIAEEAGVAYDTIRKWLKVHRLQFTKKENAIIAGGIWNKGLPSEQQPGYGRMVSAETREKMRQSSRQGAASNLYIDGRSKAYPFRLQVAHWQLKHKYAVSLKHGHQCAQCGSTGELDLDHIIPVSQDRTRAFDVDNLQVLCQPCHRAKTTRETTQAVQTVRWKQIVSIEPVGERMTYDLEVDHDSHNYIANGIVTHNSQRYADVTQLPSAGYREARMQDPNNRQNSIPTEERYMHKWWAEMQRGVETIAHEVYERALARGLAKEVARAVLPEGLTATKMYMKGSVRSWIHFCQLRMSNGTQRETQMIAEQCYELLRREYPSVVEALTEAQTPLPS